jgi:ubiquinone/menaquinone biosynthesis C-methylase UbiE
MNRMLSRFSLLASKLRRPAFFTKDYWDSIGQVHGNMDSKALDSYSQRIIQSIKPGIGEKILDIGCGEGSVLRKTEERCGATLIGMDFSKKLTKTARINCVSPILLGDALSLPFNDSCLDKVYSFEVMQYLSEKLLERYVLENIRVVKPHGTIYLLAVPEKTRVFKYYVSFSQKCLYSLSLLFKSGLFANQLGVWHERKNYYRIAKKLNLRIKIVTDSTYRMDIVLNKN